MGQKITIEPITRIEGHARVTIQVDDAGAVEHAYFHVDQFRGFEKFSQGRMFFEMPSITPRICGICPVSHHLVSAKACDAIVGAQGTHSRPEDRVPLGCVLAGADVVAVDAVAAVSVSSGRSYA